MAARAGRAGLRGRRGGSVGLVAWLTADPRRRERAEADLRRYYGADLNRLDVRQAAALFKSLPPDAASHTPDGAWPVSIELLAQVAEILHALYRSHLGANGVPQRDIPPPLRVPRPGDAAPTRRPARSPEEVRAVIEHAWGPSHG
ncbi:hypothetical protein [Actinomadura rayongensis]|uniref:Uncharacterized protein n=1 Tax=Actinomadura rayongensis TaxID=1429076 RepID=A0A6I4WJ19_9ACTN|nr:hypothetical protein [Actinomadura rayongensis]MXQ67696.1 hypothetical protein [Actinomadura rayongensis]